MFRRQRHGQLTWVVSSICLQKETSTPCEMETNLLLSFDLNMNSSRNLTFFLQAMRGCVIYSIAVDYTCFLCIFFWPCPEFLTEVQYLHRCLYMRSQRMNIYLAEINVSGQEYTNLNPPRLPHRQLFLPGTLNEGKMIKMIKNFP